MGRWVTPHWRPPLLLRLRHGGVTGATDGLRGPRRRHGSHGGATLTQKGVTPAGLQFLGISRAKRVCLLQRFLSLVFRQRSCLFRFLLFDMDVSTGSGRDGEASLFAVTVRPHLVLHSCANHLQVPWALTPVLPLMRTVLGSLCVRLIAVAATHCCAGCFPPVSSRFLTLQSTKQGLDGQQQRLGLSK